MQDHFLNMELKLVEGTDASKFAHIYLFTKDSVPTTLTQEGIKKQIEDTDKTQLYIDWSSPQSIYILIKGEEPEDYRQAGAQLFQSLKKNRFENSVLHETSGASEAQLISFLEGLLLGSYRFTKYLKKQDTYKGNLFLHKALLQEKSIKELQTLMQGVSLTKTLVNEPPNVMNAISFSEKAKEAGRTFGFEVTVLDKTAITEHKMGGLLGVNLGSETPPTFTIFEYKPDNATNKKPLVLVGKGVMFDTGGYSLKTGGVMSTMKSDMAGGAAVLGTISAIAGNKLPYHVIGLVPATDNKISSNALVVDDVITMMDGTTVEVQNTDAEGRLVLADALAYAKKYDPELVIDIATLTGAAAAITGSFGSAVLGNAQEEIEKLKATGEKVYERLVQLPLWKEYRDLLKSEIADLKNIGGPTGGVSTAAMFLKHFTDYPWMHIDIAGPSFLKDAKGYKQAGATAVPVRLLYEFIKERAKN